MEYKDDDIENQFMPSMWSINYTGDSEKVVMEHINKVSCVSKEVKRAISHKSNVKYGARNGQVIDIFGDDILPADAAIFVYLHGGYWQSLHKDMSCYCVKPLLISGIKVIIAGYDLSPKVTLDIIVMEIKELADFILTMAKESGSKGVWFGGHSAGAHLASQMVFNDNLNDLDLTTRQKLKGLVLISGIYDLSPIQCTSANSKLNLTSKEIDLFSPLLQEKHKLSTANQINLRALIIVSENDPPGFCRQSEKFAQYLKRNKIDVDYLNINSEDHFTVVEKLSDADFELTKNIIKFITTS